MRRCSVAPWEPKQCCCLWPVMKMLAEWLRIRKTMAPVKSSFSCATPPPPKGNAGYVTLFVLRCLISMDEQNSNSSPPPRSEAHVSFPRAQQKSSHEERQAGLLPRNLGLGGRGLARHDDTHARTCACVSETGVLSKRKVWGSCKKKKKKKSMMAGGSEGGRDVILRERERESQRARERKRERWNNR